MAQLAEKRPVIALFTVNSAHLHYNEIQHVREAISSYFVVLAQNCLASTLDYVVKHVAIISALPFVHFFAIRVMKLK